MATGKNFNLIGNEKERDTFAVQQNEVVQLYGIPCKYLPKGLVNLDKIFGEDNLMEFNEAKDLTLLPEDPTSFGGQGDFFAKLGMEIIDTMVVFSEQSKFRTIVGRAPQSGDIVYIPVFTSWFKIKFDDDEGASSDSGDFYKNGGLSTYRMDLVKWSYSHETISDDIEGVEFPEETIQTDTDNDSTEDYVEKSNLIDKIDDFAEDD